MPTYTAWPTTSDVSETLANAGISLRSTVTNDYIAAKINSVSARIVHRTHRQFVTSTEDRYFDGNDSGELIIDEYVTLGTVSQIGFIITASPLTMANVVEVSQSTYGKDRIQIYRGSYPSYTGLYVDRFPAGRGNILITGTTWGYAATIPCDLWEGCRDMAAAILAAEAVTEDGRLMEGWTEADVTEKYMKGAPGEALGWSQRFEELLKEYKRPQRLHLKRMTAPLI